MDKRARFEEGRLALERGLAARQAGELEQTLVAYAEAASAFAESDQVQAHVVALNNRGAALHIMGRGEEALGAFAEAIEVAEASGQARARALSLANLGAYHLDHGELDAAEDKIRQALGLYSEAGDEGGRGMQLGNLGLIAKVRGRIEEAAAHLTEAIGAFLTAGNAVGAGRTLLTMGELLRQRGESDRARDAYERAGELLSKAGDGLGVASAVRGLGQLALRAGDLAAARSYFEQGLTLHEQLKDVQGQAAALMDLGNIADHAGEPERALQLWRRAGRMAEEAGARQGMAGAEMAVGQLLMRTSRYGEAATALGRASALYEGIEDVRGLASVRVLEGQLHQTQGRLKAAEAAWTQALEAAEAGGWGPTKATLLANLASLAETRGEVARRRELLGEVEALYASMGSAPSVHHCQLDLLELDAYAGTFATAAEALADPRLAAAEAVFNGDGHALGRLRLVNVRAVLHRCCGGWADAARLFVDYAIAAGKMGRRLDQVSALGTSMLCRLRSGAGADAQAAAGFAQEARAAGAVHSSLGHLALAVEAATAAGALEEAQGWLEALKASYGTLEEGWPHGEAMIGDVEARLLMARGEQAAARALATETCAQYRSLQDEVAARELAESVA